MTIWPYPIDWNATGVWMQAWSGFAGAGAVVYAAIKGTSSFDDWLRQRKLERKMEAGQNVLTLLYRARDAFSDIRSGFSLHTAATEAKLRELFDGYDSLSAPKKRRLAEYQFVMNKINSYSELWADYFRALPIAEAVFGPEMSRQLKEIWSARATVWTAAEAYGDPDSEPDQEFDQQCKLEMYMGIARGKKVTDPVKSKLDAAISFAESAILPILRDES